MNRFYVEHKEKFDLRPTNLCDNCDNYMGDDYYTVYFTPESQNAFTTNDNKLFVCSKECSVMLMLKYM
jgi:hypothetical protein